jgi:hypothetical protein
MAVNTLQILSINFVKIIGIIRQLIVPYTLEQNGVAK